MSKGRRHSVVVAAAGVSILVVSGCASSAPSQVSSGIAGGSSSAAVRGLVSHALGTGRGTLRTVTTPVSAEAVATTRSITVFTPPVADPDALPVLYFLHGLPGRSTDMCSNAAVDALLAAFRSGARPFIMACPDGNPTANPDSEWADSVDGRDKLETFVTGSVIDTVEGSHRRSRGMRAIGGMSMGGFGAAAIALRHPQLYSQVVSMAGYFHLDDPSQVFGSTLAEQAEHDPTALVAGASAFRWYLAEAAEDADALSAHDSERYAALLTEVGAVHDLVRTPGGHTLSWATANLGSAATFLSSGWAK